MVVVVIGGGVREGFGTCFGLVVSALVPGALKGARSCPRQPVALGRGIHARLAPVA